MIFEACKVGMSRCMGRNCFRQVARKIWHMSKRGNTSGNNYIASLDCTPIIQVQMETLPIGRQRSYIDRVNIWDVLPLKPKSVVEKERQWNRLLARSVGGCNVVADAVLSGRIGDG